MNCAVISACLGGCGEQLFTETEVRSQYDRNDAARDRRPPAKVRDIMGENRPNVRGRVLVGTED
ncbi:MAG: hypothetical protein HBSAPP03_05310 [Phycisphaerae bacterium]|nr:MAG: hypothetical protein HBSAPP03_05310 [Phycisphaerae bacterium]